MIRPCNSNIIEALRLSDKLIRLAEQGDADLEDDNCIALYGMIRDCGYRIRKTAENERERHIAAGVWDEEPASNAS